MIIENKKGDDKMNEIFEEMLKDFFQLTEAWDELKAKYETDENEAE